MKAINISSVVLAASLFAVNAHGQAQLIKEKAKNFRDANNDAQGASAASTPGAPPSAAPLVPAGPQGISPLQQQSIVKFGQDLAAIKPGVAVAAEQKQLLQADALLLAKGSLKPSKVALTKLVDDLSAALAGKGVALKDPAPLAKAINVMVNSGTLTPNQIEPSTTSAQAQLKAAGVPETDAKKIVGDLNAMFLEMRKSAAKLY